MSEVASAATFDATLDVLRSPACRRSQHNPGVTEAPRPERLVGIVFLGLGRSNVYVQQDVQPGSRLAFTLHNAALDPQSFRYTQLKTNEHISLTLRAFWPS
jgi:hypothetical protein